MKTFSPDDVYGLPPSRREEYARMDVDAIRHRWDVKARRWDADLADPHCHLHVDEGYERFMDAAKQAIDAQKAFCRVHTLVDLGCGTGAVLDRFIGDFSDGVGVDISEKMLSAAESKAIPRSRWINGNAFELSKRISGAGAVLSRGILLSHYGDAWASTLLKEIFDSLAPGGFMLFDFLNEHARGDFVSNPENKSYFRGEELLVYVRNIGFCAERLLGESNRRVLFLFARRRAP